MAATNDGALSPRTALLRLVGVDDPDGLKEELARCGLGPTHVLDTAGNSLLHVAVTYSATSTLQWLLAARAEPNLPDAHGMTPLHLASTDGAIEVVEALLTASADVHLRSEDCLVRIGRMPMYVCGGRTPLHVASAVDVVRVLLAAAADANAVDLDGCTPWDVALRDGSKPRLDLAEALRPGVAIPDSAELEEARRATNRARATRLTLKDTRQRLFEESDSFGSVGSGEGSTDEVGGEALRADSPRASLEADADTPWCLASVDDSLALQCLKVDRGPNRYRALRGSHLWQPQSALLTAAVSPFVGTCVLHSAAGTRAVAGADDPPPLTPPEAAYSWCYCGHQLGSFSGQLGDGAAVCAALRKRHGCSQWELSWKGIGRTPFSRDGTTGRKSMGSCVRELILSEALAAMGIPCTRGLAIFASAAFLERSKLAALDAGGPAAHIEGMVARCPALIIGKAWCSNCKATKSIFAELEASYDTLELEDADQKPLVANPQAYQDHLETMTGARTVPRVFVGGQLLGGRDDVEALQRKGKLRELLSESGVLGPKPGSKGGTGSEGVSEELGVAGGLLVRACPGAGMVRFGTFDIANGPELDERNGRSGPSSGDCQLIASLASFVAGDGGAAALLRNACHRSALLVARWAALGIVHGMLNTDNLQVEGVMIDVTSACFMPVFDPHFDGGGPPAARGRYCYRKQAVAVYWGLRKLADALSRGAKLLPEGEASSIVARFPRLYAAAWLGEMRAKLGLADTQDGGGIHQARADRALLRRLFSTMEETFADFTASFHCLVPPRPQDGAAMLDRLAACGAPLPAASTRAAELRARAARIRPGEPRELLNQLAGSAEHVPDSEPSSARVQRRIAQRLARHDEADRLEEASTVAESLDSVALYAADVKAWTSWLEEYAERCSQLGVAGVDEAAMSRANPKFVPRPWVVDAAAVAAEGGDFAPARRLLELLPRAFERSADFGELGRSTPPDS